MPASRALALFALLGLGCTAISQSGAEVDGGKEAGAIAVDLDEDGCGDLVVNTLADTRVLSGDCDGGFPSYLDVTDTQAPGMTRTVAERSVVAADLNNDGFRDVVRNSYGRLELYLNAGPGSTPPYRLGTTTGDPDLVLGAADFEAPINLEGVVILDYDGDGWLDLAAQSSGIELLHNPGDGTAGFTVATTSSDRRGLPTGVVNGDYATAADVDADGDVDLLVRNVATPALWLNDGAGRFTAAASFTPTADVNLKSGAAFCDLDGDGDLDLYWGGVDGARPDALWLQGPPGVFSPAPAPNGAAFSTDVVCGDVDQDGDQDLGLAHAAGIRVLQNEGAGTFVTHDHEVLDGGPVYALALADLEGDGDLDLYANREGENGLWRNDLNGTQGLSIALRTALPGHAERDAIGATVRLLTCAGAPASPRQEVSGGRGHGTQDSPVLHFGLADATPRVIEARFVGGAVRRRAVNPASTPPTRIVTVRERDPELLFACNQPSLVRLPDAPSAHDNGASSLLADGRLLYFGGSPAPKSSDVLDPFLGRWVTTGDTVDDHGWIGATTLPTGEVLTMDTGIEPCLLYSPDGGVWSQCTFGGLLRDQYALLVLPEGGALLTGGAGPTAAVDRFDPATAQWTAQPPMIVPRVDFAAALLDDGSVLAVGGGAESTERRAADGAWEDAGLLPDPAGSPCLVRLWDGRVLAGDPDRSLLYSPDGGWAEVTDAGTLTDCRAAALLPGGRAVARFGSPGSAWLFDPLLETWQEGPAFDAGAGVAYSAVLPTGRWAVMSGGVTELLDPGSERWADAPAPPNPTAGASLTLLADGRALSVGGGSASRFSVAAGWSAATPPWRARQGHQATLLAGGRVLITGGQDASGAAVSEPELYDPSTDAWILLSPVAATAGAHTATPLLDGRALIVSASAATLFDPATLSFSAELSLGAPRPGHTATRLRDGRVLLAGGGSATSELFDPSAGTFTPSGALTEARTDPAAVLFPGGEVLLTGGATAELWTPSTGTWTAAGTLAAARTGHRAVLLRNGKVLLAGGGAEPELFDPLARTGRLLPASLAASSDERLARLGDGQVLRLSSGGAQLLDEGRGGLARAPELTSAVVDGGTLFVSGSGWLSAPQGSDGQLRSASANLPVLFVERPDTQELHPAPLSGWTNQGGQAPLGPALGSSAAFVVVTGVPSSARGFEVGGLDAGCGGATDCATRRCEASRCCQACADGTCRTDGCPGSGPLDAGVDAGPDAGGDAGSDAGSDAGTDAGFDAGFDAGPPSELTVGCGCGAGGGGPVWLALLALVLLVRRLSA